MLPRNVLIFHAGALGDFVLTFPVVLALGRVMPQSRIFVVTHAQKAQLAEKLLGVHGCDVEAGWGGLFGHGQLAERPAKLLAGGQLVVDFTAGGVPRPEAFAAHTPARVLTLPHRPADDYPGHVLDAHADALAGEPAIAAAVASMRRHVQTTGLLPNRSAEPGRVVLHPGSGGRDKCWPAARWCDLAAALRTAGRHVTVLLGEVERERLTAGELAALRHAADAVAEPADLLALAGVLSTAGSYVGHDTGPTHLAAVLGVPTLALLGPASRPAMWGPVGPAVRTLQTPAWDALHPDAVLAAVPQPVHQAAPPATQAAQAAARPAAVH